MGASTTMLGVVGFGVVCKSTVCGAMVCGATPAAGWPDGMGRASGDFELSDMFIGVDGGRSCRSAGGETESASPTSEI